jgi:MFS family permease
MNAPETSAPGAKKYENARLLLSIFLPLYAMHCVEQIYFIFGNVLRGSYGMSSETTGLVLGAFFVTIVLVRPAGGWLLENFGIRLTLMTSSAVGLAGCGLLFLSRDAAIMIIGRCLSGASFGIFTMGLFSYQALTVPEEIRGASFGLTASGGMLPSATVIPLGEWLLRSSRTGLYLAIGPLLCVLCFLLGTRVGAKKIKSGNAPRRWGGYRDLIASKPFVMLALTGSMLALVDASSVSMSLLAAEHGLIASYYMASASIAGVLVRVAGARVLNVLPRAFCLAPCGLLMSGSLFTMTLAPSNATFLVCGIAMGVGIGAGYPMLLASVSDILPPELRPKGTASALLLFDTGWAATPLLVGYVTPVLGLANTFRALSIVAFVTLTLLITFYWAPRQMRVGRASH